MHDRDHGAGAGGGGYPFSLQEVEDRLGRRRDRRSMLRRKAGAGRPVPSGEVTVARNEFGEKVTRVDGTIPADLEVARGDRFLFVSYDQASLTHGLHRYPAKFFPELPRWFIERWSREGDLILDPFSGSGTTGVEALLARRHSVGIDVDPFSRLLARVKTTPLPERPLAQAQAFLVRSAEAFRPSMVREEDIPEFPYRDSWFRREILLEMAHLRRAVAGLDAGGAVRDFFRICLSSIVRGVSNADDNCTRTVIRKKLGKVVDPGMALSRFVEAILVAVPRMIEFSRRCPAGIRADLPDGMDARSIGYPDSTFDLAMTSPPYANAVDYPRTHQLEMYWLGLATGSLNALKRAHIGTEIVGASDYREARRIGIRQADSILGRIFRRDPRRAYIAWKYLDDMRGNLREVSRVLRPGGRYVVVVGNNRIRGEVFESWKYLMSMAGGAGFRVETCFASEIIKHFIKVPREERIDTDWVLVLRKRR